MLILAVESSTRVASVALLRGSQVLGELTSDDPKSHSEFINPAIEQLLMKSKVALPDIERFAVDVGPGSFTGIRVAVSVVRALAFMQKRKVFIRQSLHLLLDQTSKDCISIINAYKNMVFFSYKKNGAEPTMSEVLPAEGLELYLQKLGIHQPIHCVGDAFDAYQNVFTENLKQILVRDSSLSDHPSAVVLAQQSQISSAQTLDWKSIIPLYLRASAAEENLKSK